MKYLLLIFIVYQYSLSFASDICTRSPQVVSSLEKQLAKKCTNITSKDLEALTSFEIAQASSDNYLLKKTDFENMSSLKKLTIHEDAELSGFEEGAFTHLRNLQSLNISLLHDLDDLIPLPPNLFKDLKSLKVLNLIRIPITTIPNKLLSSLSSLEFLSITFYALEADNSVPEDLFWGLNHLRALTLSKIEINRSIPKNFSFSALAFKDLTKLEFLELISEIRYLDENIFSNTQNLNYLNIEALRTKELPSKLFKNLKKLFHLGLNYSTLEIFPADVFSDLKPGATISLMNSFRAIPREKCEDLKPMYPSFKIMCKDRPPYMK